MSGIRELFDLNGDGKLDGIEMAFAYSVIFGEEDSRNDDAEYDNDSDEEE